MQLHCWEFCYWFGVEPTLHPNLITASNSNNVLAGVMFNYKNNFLIYDFENQSEEQPVVLIQFSLGDFYE